MNRRVVSLGGLVASGLGQVLGAALDYGVASTLSVAYRAAVGLLIAVLFGTYLVRGDDLNGLARRPLFVAVSLLGAFASVAFAGSVLVGA